MKGPSLPFLILSAAAVAAHNEDLMFGSMLIDRASNASACSLDQTQPPGDLTLCGNNTLAQVWRPKARFLAPEGWMNDPQGLFQRADGSYHAGYQCHPQHVQWGNISQCSATSKDFTHWTDLPSWENPKTIWPSEIYDMRGVFDGSIIPKGWNGYPTTIYTSTFTGPLGSTSSPAETEGTEAQSMAYTKDGGATWIKLDFGVNPIIQQWPEPGLTGFRDPFVFESPRLARLLGNATIANLTAPTGDYFLTVSGGIRLDFNAGGGPRLFLYRQTSNTDWTKWTYLGPIISLPALTAFSDWTGSVGINFETSGVTRLNEEGHATDAGTDSTALDIVTYGTEGGRGNSHEGHWPLWSAVDLTASNGSVTGTVKFSGALDWGRTYAFTYMPVTTGHRKRMVTVGWGYEDDESLVLAKQRGYQGSFTLFRDLFVKVIPNVDPATAALNETTSWTTRKEKDGSTSVVTLGQKIVPETLAAYRSESHVSYPSARKLNGTAGYVPFKTRPSGRHYAVTGSFTLSGGPAAPQVGFRVLASDEEWTDIYYDPRNETLIVARNHSSLVTSYGNETEIGKLRLFDIIDKKGISKQQALNLTVIVDNSAIEVYANDQTVITTRAYPWLTASKGVGFLSQNGGVNGSVAVSEVELWDGLINAWSKRPKNTSKPLLWDGALPSSAGWGDLWAGW